MLTMQKFDKEQLVNGMLRYGIMSAWMPRMAFTYTYACKSAAHQTAMLVNSPISIM